MKQEEINKHENEKTKNVIIFIWKWKKYDKNYYIVNYMRKYNIVFKTQSIIFQNNQLIML